MAEIRGQPGLLRRVEEREWLRETSSSLAKFFCISIITTRPICF